MREKRWGLAGVVVVVAYLAAVAATVGVRGTGVRPLYDSLTPPAAYRWVNPPRLFRPGNVKPKPISEQVSAIGPQSPATSAATPDGQIIVNLPAGAIPAHAGDTSATISLTPVDPASLSPLPSGRYPYGNAYRLTITDKPSGTEVTTLATPGNLILASPAVGNALLTSPGGNGWTVIPAHLFAPTNLLIGASITACGYYLVAGSVPVAGKSSPTTSSSSNALLIGAIVVVLAIALLAIAYTATRRLRRG